MAWQGDGTFTRSNGTNSGDETWQDDAAAGTAIRADRHDTHDQDLADGIAACLTKNNETKPTASFLPNASATYNLGSKALQWVSGFLSGGLTFKERADHVQSPAATYGELWVKSDTPNALMFTDDTGLDYNLTAESPTLGTEQATTSGTEIDFTGIPSWAKRVTINFVGVSTSGTDPIWIQLGDSGGFETTGYLGAASRLSASAVATENETSAVLVNINAAGSVLHGSVALTLQNSATFTWVASGTIGQSNTTRVILTGATKTLSAALDSVRITTSTATDTFDAGAINILYE